MVATAFGKAAVDLLAAGETAKMVTWRNGQVEAVALEVVVAQSPLCVAPNHYLVQTARALGIYVGEEIGDRNCIYPNTVQIRP